MWKNAYVPNRKSYIFWYRLICVMLLHTQNTSIMQDPQRRQPPRNTYHGWTTGKWHKSPMQPYINMRTISKADQFTHILPLAISCITTPRYYFQGTGGCTPLWHTFGGQQQYLHVHCSVLLLLLLFCFVVILHLSLWIYNYRWITTATTKLHSNNKIKRPIIRTKRLSK